MMAAPTIPIGEAVKERNPRRRVLRLRPVHTTRAQERQIARAYAGLMRIWTRAAKEIIARYSADPDRMQDAAFADRGDWVAIIMEMIQQEAELYIATEAQVLFEEWGDDMVRWHAERMVERLKYAGDIELSTALIAPATPTVETAVRYNISLISDLSDEMRGKMEEVVFRGFQQRLRADDIAKEIRHVTGMGRSRARRIAGDQVVKMGAALDRERDQQMGFEEFVWRHSRKKHARPEHKARDGKRFRYDDPDLVGDMPGDAPFCGCVAEPYMELE